MTNAVIEKIRNLINLNPHVQELFSISNNVVVRYDGDTKTIIFGTTTKPSCLLFKFKEEKKRRR